MSARRTVLVSLLVVLGTVLAVTVGATLAAGAPTTGGQAALGDTVRQTANNSTNATNASLGTQVSSFMLSSSAEVDDTVDSGMWAAAFNRSNGSAQAALVHARTGTLDRRLDRLHNRSRALAAARENGSISELAYAARASHIAARIGTLEDAIDDTARAATEAGEDDADLETLRTEARNMSGHEVAETARGLGVFDPHDRGPDDRGPPEDRGPDDRGPSGANGPDADEEETDDGTVDTDDEDADDDDEVSTDTDD